MDTLTGLGHWEHVKALQTMPKAKDTRIVYYGNVQIYLTGKWVRLYKVVLHHDREYRLYGPDYWRACVRWRRFYLK